MIENIRDEVDPCNRDDAYKYKIGDRTGGLRDWSSPQKQLV